MQKEFRQQSIDKKVLNAKVFKYLSILILVFVHFFSVQAQIERTKTWVFGEGVGLIFNKNGFDTFSVTPNLNSFEGVGIWNDRNGDLVYYTDQSKMYNNKDSLVNKDFILWGGGSSVQGIILTSLDDTMFHVFGTVGEPNSVGGLYYSQYDCANDSWHMKAEKIIQRISECQTHINHQNGKWQWVVSHSLNGNTFYSYLIKEDGLEKCPTISNVGPHYKDEYPGHGMLKFSEDGKFLYSATNTLEQIIIYNFNIQTGYIGYNQTINCVDGRPYGIEVFNNYLYASMTDLDYNLVRYNLNNLTQPALNNSRVLLKESSDVYGSIQRSMDNKLYITQYYDEKLGVIENINGKDSFYTTDSLSDYKEIFAGFPNFNASFFHTPSLDFTYKHTCHTLNFDLGAKDTFTANTFTWNISKGATKESKTGKELNYTFLDTGKWKVQLIANNGTRTDTSEKAIEVFGINPQGFLGKDIHHSFGTPVSGTLDAPNNQHCSHWWKLGDTTETLGSSYSYTDTGAYICKTTNKHFCHRWDTVQVKVCDTGFSVINREKDTLFPVNVLDSNIWYKDGIKLGEAPRITLSSQDNYTLIQTNEFGCNDTAKLAVTFLYSSIKSVSKSDVYIYPNPNQGEFTIVGLRPNAGINIIDIHGRKVGFTKTGDSIKLDSVVSHGIYYLIIDGRVIKPIIFD